MEAAVTCLRRAGYRTHALQLIKKYKHKHQHEWVVELLLEEESEAYKQAARALESHGEFDSSDSAQKKSNTKSNVNNTNNDEISVYAKEALEYMRGLPQESVEFLLSKFGRQLISSQPDAVTELVGDLCTGVYQPMGGLFAEAIVASKLAEAAAKADLDEETGFDNKKNKGNKKGQTTTSAATSSLNNDGTTSVSRKSNPDAFMTLFIDNTSNLRLFLQRIVDQATGNNSKSSDSVSECVANTLLELLLKDWSQNEEVGEGGGSTMVDPGVLSARKATKAAAVMSVLQNFKCIPYDKFHALVQVQVEILLLFTYIYILCALFKLNI